MWRLVDIWWDFHSILIWQERKKVLGTGIWLLTIKTDFQRRKTNTSYWNTSKILSSTCNHSVVIFSRTFSILFQHLKLCITTSSLSTDWRILDKCRKYWFPVDGHFYEVFFRQHRVTHVSFATIRKFFGNMHESRSPRIIIIIRNKVYEQELLRDAFMGLDYLTLISPWLAFSEANRLVINAPIWKWIHYTKFHIKKQKGHNILPYIALFKDLKSKVYGFLLPEDLKNTNNEFLLNSKCAIDLEIF